jgi:hypothetical protein
MRGRKKDKGYRHGTPLGEFSTLVPLFLIPSHRVSFKPGALFMGVMFKTFFYLQWAVKLGWKRVPVVHVDHPLDEKVPFKPGLAPVYLDFINFWLRALSMLLVRLGPGRGLPYCASFFTYLGRAYHEAALIYNFRLTTTRRPQSKRRLIRSIHRVDPHLLCVPSLHVIIVTLTWAFCRRALAAERARIPQEDAERYLRELYAGAVEIVETVLYIKQHSVNCIPAALYLLRSYAPELFSADDAAALIDALFAESRDVPQADKERIRAYIHFQFECLLLEGALEDDWTAPVKRRLLEMR